MIEDGDTLVLKAWDGPAATEHVRIPIGQGICGLAAREARTVVVDDVNKDPRYLACFLQTRSEIVVPVFSEGRVVGEIDIDSDRPAAFTEADRTLLESVADLLGKASMRTGR
jgi:GAF domain-containing protein